VRVKLSSNSRFRRRASATCRTCQFQLSVRNRRGGCASLNLKYLKRIFRALFFKKLAGGKRTGKTFPKNKPRRSGLSKTEQRYLATRALSFRVLLVRPRSLCSACRRSWIDTLEVLAKLLHFLVMQKRGGYAKALSTTRPKYFAACNFTFASFSFCVFACAIISCFSASRRAISIRAVLS
jgi:hypothetical protein